MWNRKHRNSSSTSRRHPTEAEVEGIVRRGLAEEAPAPIPGRVVIHPEKQGCDPYDSRGASLSKKSRAQARRRKEASGTDPYNTADRQGGKPRRWWD